MSSESTQDAVRDGIVIPTMPHNHPILYRQTRHTTSGIDVNWLWAHRNEEFLRPLFMELFFGRGGHVDILSLKWDDIEIIYNARSRLGKFFTNIGRRYREKKMKTIKASLDEYLCDDVIELCTQFSM